MISNLYGVFSFRLDARESGSAPSAELPNLGVAIPREAQAESKAGRNGWA
jgi:hypothetical protein